jgi:hypothetical protein
LFTDLVIRRPPKVWLVKDIGQPFVWGLLRGGIYLPADFAKLDSPKHRRGVLGHELSHFLRFDAAVNMLQIIVQAVFWFHPFVWWANKKIRAEREKCCDEMAIARLGAKAKDYSTAIVNTLIAEHRAAKPIPSLAIAGPVKNVEDRIKTILNPNKKFYERPTFIVIITILLLALIAVPTTLALTSRPAIKTDVQPEGQQEQFTANLPNDVTVEPVGVYEQPSVTELLDRYAANQDKIGSSIKYKYELSGVGSGRAFSKLSEVRCEGNRIRIVTHSEPDRVLEKRPLHTTSPPVDDPPGYGPPGDDPPGDDPPGYDPPGYGPPGYGPPDVGKGHYESFLWQDDWRLRYHRTVGSEYKPLGSVGIERIKKPAHNSGYKVICHEDGYIWGFFHGHGNLERVDAIVRKAKEVSVRNNMGKAGGSRCYIIDAVTEHGKYVLWLDPERGYNIVKAQFLQREGDLNWNYEPLRKGASKHWSVRNVHLEEIDGLWIPVEADYEYKWTGANAHHYKGHIKRTEVKLNPEFGPDAFTVNDIADWASVTLSGSYAIEDPWSWYYWWNKGQVVDYQGRVVEYKVKRPGEPILVGKPLPGWETLGLNIDERELEGKRVLVFFGDMNEFPYVSWRLVGNLADRYEKLKQKGIMIVIVQVPKLPAGTLKEWEKQYPDIMPFPFKVNMADEAVVRVRKEWGVRGLPWLILTDTEHVVTAEGFRLPQLLGKPLPDLKDYENIDLTKTKGKRLLVCAGDLNGSTWDCMKKLDGMSGELEREGVGVLCLQAQYEGHEVDEKKLRSYYKKYNNNVPFAVPVGLSEKPFRQLWDEWGLPRVSQGLFPWLILTNEEHVVVAERFWIGQVDEVIKRSAGAKPEDNPLICLAPD